METVTNKILWVDLETSGSDEEERGAAILEAGFYLTTAAPKFEPKGELEFVFGLNDTQLLELPNWDSIVLQMHSKTGLLEQAIKERPLSDYASRVKLVAEVSKLIDIPPRAIILWGGSGVSHFDRRWIKKFIPELHNMLTHYALDVGVMRRMFDSAAKQHQPLFEDKPHRALPDAKLAAAQWKYYWNWINDFAE